VTPEAIAAVEAIVKDNRRVTVHDIAAHLDMSDGSEHNTVHDVLQFHKVSARWVPHQLTAELKERRVDACQELLKRFEAEGDPTIHPSLALQPLPGLGLPHKTPPFISIRSSSPPSSCP
jgi:hypothetical protein